MFPEEIIDILKDNNLYVKKSLGQNFLLCEDVLDDIVLSSSISLGENILEVGPGLGFLTKRLLAVNANVTAIELSDDMVRFLRKGIQDKHFNLLHADVLQTRIADVYNDIRTEQIVNDPNRRIGAYKVIANIPYYLTGKLIPFFLENELKPQELVLMIQKEVAERLVVKDGKQSKLSIAVQFYADVEYLVDVPKECFYPEPKINSVVIKITPRKEIPDVDQKLFFRIMRAAFSNKRKQMHNGLSGVLQMERGAVLGWLERASIAHDVRPEKLRVEDYVRLVNAY